MIVVDTNVISYLFLSSPFSTAVETLYLQDSEWAAPMLWQSEFRNVLTLYVRKGILTTDETIDIFNKAAQLVKGREFQPVPGNVLRLSAESGCSAYDCEFVDTAAGLGVPLYTADRKLLKAFPDITRSITGP